MMLTLILPEEICRETLEVYDSEIENEISFSRARRVLLMKKKFKRALNKAMGYKGWITEFKDDKWLRENVRRLKGIIG